MFSIREKNEQKRLVTVQNNFTLPLNSSIGSGFVSTLFDYELSLLFHTLYSNKQAAYF